nr:Annexin repeat domain containing protein [Haemonchus contortus]
MATIHPSASFDEDLAAEALERAMRGYGTDKQKVIEILVRCNNAQRQMIRTPYKVRYGKDLENELRRELSGDLEDVILALMQTPTKRDVLDLQKAMKGFGTNEKVLIEIIASRSNDELRAIRNTFYTTYDKSLEETIWSETSGDFRRMLVLLIQGTRDEYGIPQYHKAVQDAQQIMRACDKKSGQDKFEAFKILATASPSHLAYVYSELETISGYSIEKTIDHEYSGDMKTLLLALVMVSQSKPKFFAHQIHNAIKGLGVRDKDLIRVLVSRAETDLATIQMEYERLFNKSLEQVIRDECKGDYRDALLRIVKGNRSRY